MLCAIQYVFLLTQTLPMVATAGIERVVRLHYSTPASIEHTLDDYLANRPSTRSRMRAMNTAAVVRAIRRNHGRLDSDSDSDSAEATDRAEEHLAAHYEPDGVPRPPTAAELADEEAIALFDELLREEEPRTLFSSDRYVDLSDDSEAETTSTSSDE